MAGCLKFVCPVPKCTAANQTALNRTIRSQAKACITKAVSNWHLYIL